MKLRRGARTIALQALYEIDIARHPVETVLTQRLLEASLPQPGDAFTRQLVTGVVKHKEMLDSWIARHAPERPVTELAVIDRNILRIALLELAGGSDAPVKVIINEAVELAKRFGSDSSARFINGVLGVFVEAGTWPRLTSTSLDADALLVPTGTSG